MTCVRLNFNYFDRDSDFLTHVMIINDCIREIHEDRSLYSSFKLSIDAFTNELLNVLFNAMANVAIYNA